MATQAFEQPESEDVIAAAAALGPVLETYRRTGFVGELAFRLKTIETATGRELLHPVVPRRNCRHCSCLLESVELPLQSHCSSTTGIVRKMVAGRNRVGGAFHATSRWLAPRPEPGARPLLQPQESHGRGDTLEQAQSGCIGEALERYSAIFCGDEKLIVGTQDDLAVIDPASILLYSERQYRDRELTNRVLPERYFVGEPLDRSTPLRWMAALDLAAGTTVYAPAACCLMWYECALGEPEYARADSLGCASGRTMEVALLHALCELVERDAMAIWWYNRVRRPAVRVSSFGSEALLRIDEGLRQMGRTLVLLDVTTDIRVPTYVAIAARQDGTEPVFGAAAHPSPRLAAWKAASEIGQIIFNLLQEQGMQREYREWLAGATVESDTYLSPTQENSAPEELVAPNAQDELRFVLKALDAVGLRAFAVDLSRTDVLLKTVRAFVPGLRHIWNRRAPGRLYDVPVRLGWRETTLGEDELNSRLCMV